MKKVFCYELRRVLFSWLFLAMLVVNGMYAWYVLTSEIISGVAHTAPFSVWSYCTYIGEAMPMGMITVLLLLAGYYGKKQKQAEILLSAAPVTPAQHLVLRSLVLGVCFLVVCAVIMIAAAVFYISFFQYSDYAVFLLPACLLIIPCFSFMLGLGHLLGRLHQGFVYLLAGLASLIRLAAADYKWDLFCAGYFSGYPLTLAPGESGEPGFYMQPAWVAFRILYFLLGMGFLFLSVHCARRKLARDV